MKFPGRICVAVAVALGAAFVGACDTEEEPPDAPPATEVQVILGLERDADAGAAVYESACSESFCHGPDGAANSSVPALAVAVPELSDEELTILMLEGNVSDGGTMPPVCWPPGCERLPAQEAADVLGYLRATFP